MKYSTRELVLLAVFGALWGVIEITLGSVLKSLNVPLSGAILAAIGLTVAMIGRLFVPKKGATLFIGVIATLLKLFSLGGAVVGPMIGIISEALVAEIVLSAMGKPSQFSFILASAAGVAWALVQPFVTGPLLFGRTIFVVWLNFLDRGARILGQDSGAVFWIILILVLLHLVVGATSGVLAWGVGGRLSTRLGQLTSYNAKKLMENTK